MREFLEGYLGNEMVHLSPCKAELSAGISMILPVLLAIRLCRGLGTAVW